MHIASIAIDLGKTTFHLVALEELNEVLVSQEVLRTQLLASTANLPLDSQGVSASHTSGRETGLFRLDVRSAR